MPAIGGVTGTCHFSIIEIGSVRDGFWSLNVQDCRPVTLRLNEALRKMLIKHLIPV